MGDFFIKLLRKFKYVKELNYNNGNIVMYNTTQETICHIPFSELKALHPKPIKEQLSQDNSSNSMKIHYRSLPVKQG